MEEGCDAEAPVPAAAAAVPDRGRVESHIRVLEILWIVLSVLRLFPAVALLTMGNVGFPPMPNHMAGFMRPLMGFLGLALAVTAALGFVTAWGLMTRQSWARMLAIVLGCIALIDIPFGTALGIYTLWVLVPAESEREFRRLVGTS
jgi:hypothetical protein